MMLVLLSAVAICWFTRPARVSVVAVILVDEPRYIIPDPSRAARDATRQAQFVGRQTKLFTSRAVLGPALEKLRRAKVPLMVAQKDPFGFLASQIKVTVIDDTNFVEIRMAGNQKSARQCLQIVDAVVDSYMSFVRSYGKNLDYRWISLLEHEQKRREEDIILLRESIRELEIAKADTFFERKKLSRLERAYDEVSWQVTVSKVNRNAPARIQLIDPAAIHRGK